MTREKGEVKAQHDHAHAHDHEHDHDHDHDHEHDHAHDHDHDHDHAHDHEHDHEHGHDHERGHAHGIPRSIQGGWAFAIGVVLNITFAVVEAVYGVISHSMALVADAAHNFSDVLGLALAWGAIELAKRAPTPRQTYGFRRSTILAALANGLMILVAIGGVGWEAIERLQNPPSVDGVTIMAVAAMGVVVNGVSAALFAKGQKHDLNVRAAFMHLLADAAVSFGVVIAGLLLLKTGLNWIDPVMSLVVVVVILWGTWGLLREATSLAMDAVPDHIDPQQVRNYLVSLPGVTAVHDLHIWAMSTTETAMTVHIALPWPTTPPEFLRELTQELEKRFNIHHATIQLEPCEDAHKCRQAPDHMV